MHEALDRRPLDHCVVGRQEHRLAQLVVPWPVGEPLPVVSRCQSWKFHVSPTAAATDPVGVGIDVKSTGIETKPSDPEDSTLPA